MPDNPFYTASGAPGTGAEGLSAQMRGEFRLIQTGFTLLPRISTTGQFGTVFIQQGSYTFTLPSSDGTLALAADLMAEVTRAQGAELSQATTIAGLSTSTTAAMAAEVSRATAAENVISAALATETQQRTTSVATEVADRKAAIAALSSGSSSTIGGVSAALNQEISDRMAGDGALTVRLSNAENAAANESGRATAAENAIVVSLNSEISRAGGAEYNVLQAVYAETARAQGVERTLQPALGFTAYPASNPADYVTGSRLTTALSPYPTYDYVYANYAGLKYVQGTFALNTDANGFPVARQFASVSFNQLYPQYIQTRGSVQANASGYQLSPSGLASGAFNGMNISIDANGNGMLAFSYMATSDGRLKSDRVAITAEQGERFVRECPAYLYVKNGNREAGFIAQDLGKAGFSDTLHAWEAGHVKIPDEAFGYTGPKGQYLIMPDKTPTAYLAAALASALDKIEALTRTVEQISAKAGS